MKVIEINPNTNYPLWKYFRKSLKNKFIIRYQYSRNIQDDESDPISIKIKEKNGILSFCSSYIGKIYITTAVIDNLKYLEMFKNIILKYEKEIGNNVTLKINNVKLK